VIVVDASAMVEALVGRAPHEDLLDALSGDVDARHLLDVDIKHHPHWGMWTH